MEAKAEIVVTTELRLKAIVADAVNVALRHWQPPITACIPEEPVSPYGDFKWLSETCTGIPTSTLRIKSASGEIPGVMKFGRRVLYNKADVLNWLNSQTNKKLSHD